MKVRMVFKISLIADIDEQIYANEISQIEKTLGTSFDIGIDELSYLDEKIDDYVYIERENIEMEYTQVLDIKKVE